MYKRQEYFNELPDYANIKFRPAQGAYEDFKVGGAADHPYIDVYKRQISNRPDCFAACRLRRFR